MHQLLDGDVDQVGEVVFGARGLDQRAEHDAPGGRPERLHLQVGADDAEMALARARGVVAGDAGRGRHSYTVRDVLHDRGGDRVQVDRIAQALVGLELHEEADARGAPLGGPVGERDVLPRRGIHQRQVAAAAIRRTI